MQKAQTRGSVSGDKIPFYPKNTASWWSRVEDLLWPEKRARDMVRRRADALAAADIDTVIQFGFHFRFDFYPYFGAMNGLFANIAEELHERGIRFLDHYSCNLQARPNSKEERFRYHTHQRHHVDLYPDEITAQTAGYAGYRFRDLCEVDLVTGGPAYTPIYQAEMLCHNNPGFLDMHAQYLKRLFSEVPLDGVETDDMCMYNYFRSCGCEHCRERFRREYGHELPPLSDTSFWGETSGELDLGSRGPGDPTTWGNYDNPAFRDWIRMRYASPVDHLKRVREVIGPDKILMTCCSTSAVEVLNSLALSYEGNIDICDWACLENCGLGKRTVNWPSIEANSILQKSIAYAKPGEPAATAAIGYTIYDDGAYLSWSLARFWGVTNWISTLTTGLLEDPGDTKEEAELIKRYNNWEKAHQLSEDPADIIDVRIAFLRANRDRAWRDENGVEYWEHAKRWSEAFAKKNFGYKFLISKELREPDFADSTKALIVFDSCACISDAEFENVKKLLKNGGRVCIVAPFGTQTETGDARDKVLLDELKTGEYGDSVIILDQEWNPDLVDQLIEKGACAPSVRVVGENQSWRARLRKSDNGYVIHLLNQDLEGIEHPFVTDRWGGEKVLKSITSHESKSPLKIDVQVPGLSASDIKESAILSPELDTARQISISNGTDGKLRLEIDMSEIHLYGTVNLPTA